MSSDMKKSRSTDEYITFALKQAETGTPGAEVIQRVAPTGSGAADAAHP